MPPISKLLAAALALSVVACSGSLGTPTSHEDEIDAGGGSADAAADDRHAARHARPLGLM
jgi:hypothetical protein